MRHRWTTFGAGLAALFLLAAADDPSKGLDIYFIDVDGGAATLLVTPEKTSILIDSGWPGRDDRDPKRIAHVLKDVAGCDHLDHLVTTHWHMDHFGGVEGLSKLVRIDHFWDRGLPDLTRPDADKAAYPDGPSAADPMGVAYLKASEGKRTVLKAGDRLSMGKLVGVVLASGGAVIDGPTSGENPACAQAPPDQPVDGSDNARSLAIHFKFGPFDFLDCGDLTWNVEKRLACPVDRVGPIDVFQVTHHGMDISNHPTLLQTIAPTVAIMDNGPRKGGAAATVKRLAGLPSIRAAYQLHKNAATAEPDNAPAERIANVDPKGGQFIRVTVAPDGSRYTVRFGADGAAQAFETK